MKFNFLQLWKLERYNFQTKIQKELFNEFIVRIRAPSKLSWIKEYSEYCDQ